MPNGPAYDSAKTLAQLVRGNRQAFSDIYKRYWQGCYQVAFKFLKSEEQAEDIVQEIFSMLWHKRQQFSEVRDLRLYLVTMTRNLTFQYLKQRARQQEIAGGYVSGRDFSENTADHILLDAQYKELLDAAVSRLSPQQQRIFYMAKEEGLTYEAIAEQLGISRITVKTYMADSLKFIRQQLQPHIGVYIVLAILLSEEF
jgi:RNA polymerase sigma-70 factor (ECF subfamily)